MTAKAWEVEMDHALGDYEGSDTPLPFPLEDMAVYISGDWGGSLQEARVYIEAARRIGAAGVAEKIKPTLVKTRPVLNEAAETIERLTKVCEATLGWLEWLEGKERSAPKSERARLVHELQKVLGRPAK